MIRLAMERSVSGGQCNSIRSLTEPISPHANNDANGRMLIWQSNQGLRVRTGAKVFVVADFWMTFEILKMPRNRFRIGGSNIHEVDDDIKTIKIGEWIPYIYLSRILTVSSII